MKIRTTMAGLWLRAARGCQGGTGVEKRGWHSTFL